MVLVALFALAYWLLRVYCLSLPAAASNVSYVWLPDGLALGALLCIRARQWPPYLLAIVVVSLFDARRELGPTLNLDSLDSLYAITVRFLFKQGCDFAGCPAANIEAQFEIVGNRGIREHGPNFGVKHFLFL